MMLSFAFLDDQTTRFFLLLLLLMKYHRQFLVLMAPVKPYFLGKYHHSFIL